MAISENRVDISSITDTIKNLKDGLSSGITKASDSLGKVKNTAGVPQNLTDKLLGMFNENMCQTPNYNLDMDSLFDSLNRLIEFGSFDICGNRISGNPFDGSLINGFNSIRANILNSIMRLGKIPNSLLDSINGNINGTLGRFKLPAGCIDGFSLNNPYNLNLSGLDKDILKNGGKFCGIKTNRINNYATMNALASNRDALYKYTSEMSDKELLESFSGFLSTRKDLNINNKIDAISNKLVVNGVTGEESSLMVNSKVKDNLFTNPDDMVAVNVDSENIIQNMDYAYTNKTDEITYGSNIKNNQIISSSSTNNTGNSYTSTGKSYTNVGNSFTKKTVEENNLSTMNSYLNTNATYNKEYNNIINGGVYVNTGLTNNNTGDEENTTGVVFINTGNNTVNIGSSGIYASDSIIGGLAYNKDVNSVNYSNDAINGLNGYNSGSSSFKGYSDSIGDNSLNNNLSNNISNSLNNSLSNNINKLTQQQLDYNKQISFGSLESLGIDRYGEKQHVKTYTSEHDRYFKVKHILNMTDKSWNKDEDNNTSYHKFKKSNSFKMMTSAMVQTRQPILDLTMDVPPREFSDYESIYILSNI